MLKIRLQRIGRRNNPSYRVVVIDSATAAKKGKPVELLGTYDTIRKTTSLNNERILYWLSTGAQASDTMHNILIKNGIIEGVKVNTLPKKSPITKKKDDSASIDQEKTATNNAQASDTAVTNTKDSTEDKKTEVSESDTSKEKSTDSNTDTGEKESQTSLPQDTPSTEG